jgi:hypothetical protein
MSIDLVVPTKISPSLQPISDQDGDPSALSVATNAVTIIGQDIVGSALPLVIQGNGVVQGQQTFGRLLRLVNGVNGTVTGGMFDFAVDASGNLQLYTGGQTSNPALTISPQGAVSIPNLAITNLTVTNLTVTKHLSAGS